MIRLAISTLALAALVALGGLLPAGAAEDECLDGQMLEVAGCVDLDTVMAGDLQISNAWVRAMQPGQKVAGAYLTILNRGDTSDRLLGATGLAASSIEFHEMRIENDIMSMRPVESGVAVDPGDKVELKPGGLHLMLTGVNHLLEAEDEIELTLDFEKAGRVVLIFPVREPATVKVHKH